MNAKQFMLIAEFILVAPASRGFNSASRRIATAFTRAEFIVRTTANFVIGLFRARRPKPPARGGCYTIIYEPYSLFA